MALAFSACEKVPVSDEPQENPFIYVISEAGTGAVLFAGRFGNQ